MQTNRTSHPKFELNASQVMKKYHHQTNSTPNHIRKYKLNMAKKKKSIPNPFKNSANQMHNGIGRENAAIVPRNRTSHPEFELHASQIPNKHHNPTPNNTRKHKQNRIKFLRRTARIICVPELGTANAAMVPRNRTSHSEFELHASQILNKYRNQHQKKPATSRHTNSTPKNLRKQKQNPIKFLRKTCRNPFTQFFRFGGSISWL